MTRPAPVGLRQRLKAARANTDQLFEVVRPDSYYERPIPERHRIIFYIGHLEAFDWNLICKGALDVPAFHPEFDKLFAFGIDPEEGKLPLDQPRDWPRLEEVRKYNQRVREVLDPLLEKAPEQLLHVALEHRLMHAETFAYMLHNLSYERKVMPAVSTMQSGSPPASSFVEIPDGPVTLGRRRDEGFGWDNEFDAHTVEVPRFAIGRCKVTNGEFLEFVRSGAPAPHFWNFHDNQWFYRGMFEEIPLPLDWPVFVTQREAVAYAAWKGKSLPTEEQFQRAAYGTADGKMLEPDLSTANVDFREWDPVSVTELSRNAFGIYQMVGNGWEWTSSVFGPFPGFKPLPFYPGYSANFFDGEHYVVKGGSQRTAACLLRSSFRNWFRAAYPYVYATFRLAEN